MKVDVQYRRVVGGDFCILADHEVCLDVEYDDGLPSGGVRALFNTDKVVNRTTYKIQEVDC